MKINENKLKEHAGSSFNITKEDGVTHLHFNSGDWLKNEGIYSDVYLGECDGCNRDKIKTIFDSFSYDKILVGGLGLGLIPNHLANKSKSVIDVIENNKELIDWVNNEKYLDDSVSIIEADIFSYTPSKKYDLILIDIWWNESDITEEIKTSLKNKYSSHLNSGGKLFLPLTEEDIK